MLFNDSRGESIARYHEAIEINSIRLTVKLLMALIRLLAKLELHQEKVQSPNKVAEPVEITAKLDGQTVLKATVESDLLPGTNPDLLTGSNRNEITQQELDPSPNLSLLEAVEYIDAEVLERHADSLIKLVELPPETLYEEADIKTFEVIDGDNQHLLTYRDGKVEKNTLANSTIEAELVSKEVQNLPEKKSQELSPQLIKPIKDERMSKLAHLIVHHRDRDEGKLAEGNNYRVERKDGNITIFAQDGRGEIFSSDKNGYKNKLSAKDYENFGKIDQFVTNFQQKKQQKVAQSEKTPRRLALERTRQL